MARWVSCSAPPSTDEPAGSGASSSSTTSTPSSAGAKPSTRAVSSARRAGLTALETTITRLPRGSGGPTSTRAVSNSWRTVCTRITPACSYSAAVVGSPEAPARTATMGLRRDRRRAMRANLRGLPKLSV